MDKKTQKILCNRTITEDLLKLAEKKKNFYTLSIFFYFLLLLLPIFKLDILGLTFPQPLVGVCFQILRECLLNGAFGNIFASLPQLGYLVLLIFLIVLFVRGLVRAFWWRNRMNQYQNNRDASHMAALCEDLFFMYMAPEVQKNSCETRQATKKAGDIGIWFHTSLLCAVGLVGRLLLLWGASSDKLLLFSTLSPSPFLLILIAIGLIGGFSATQIYRQEMNVKTKIMIRREKALVMVREEREDEPSFDQTDLYAVSEEYRKILPREIQKRKIGSILFGCVCCAALWIPVFSEKLFGGVRLLLPAVLETVTRHLFQWGQADWYWLLYLQITLLLILCAVQSFLRFADLSKKDESERLVYMILTHGNEMINSKGEFSQKWINVDGPFCPEEHGARMAGFGIFAYILMRAEYLISGLANATVEGEYGSVASFLIGLFKGALLPVLLVFAVIMVCIFCFLGSEAIVRGLLLDLGNSNTLCVELMRKKNALKDQYERKLEEKRLREEEERLAREAEERRVEQERLETIRKAEQEERIAAAVSQAMQERELTGEAEVISALKEYKEMLDEGILTPEEFENKKKQLLNS